MLGVLPLAAGMVGAGTPNRRLPSTRVLAHDLRAREAL